MIQELKKIKIAELERKIEMIENQKMKETKYSWFQKKISKKTEYEKEQAMIKQEYESRRKKIEELKEKIKKYKTTTCIQGLGLSLTEAIQILKDHNIEPILTEHDLSDVYTLDKPDIDDIKGIILVHKTGHSPTDSRLRTVKEAEIYVEGTISIAGIQIPIKTRKSRNTVHLAANGEVSSHIEGDWEDKKYAVLIPFTDVPRESFASVSPEDTYTVGGIDLTSNAWILVPKGEKERVQKNNPNVNVLEYEGKSVTGYADQLVKILGYVHKKIDKDGWTDEESNRKYHQNMLMKGYTFKSHSNSEDSYNENFETYIQHIIQIMQYVQIAPEVLNDETFVKELTDLLESRIRLTAYQTKNASETVMNMQRRLAEEGFNIPSEEIEDISKTVANSFDIGYSMVKEIMKLLMSFNKKTMTEEITYQEQNNRKR